MTEVNTAYRPDHDTFADDDPLAELARIVSGEPYDKLHAQALAQSKQHMQPVTAEPVLADDQIDFDIEAELMRELEEADPSAIHAGDISAEKPVYMADEISTTQPPVYEDDISLEDQLMAELSVEQGFDKGAEVTDNGFSSVDEPSVHPQAEFNSAFTATEPYSEDYAGESDPYKTLDRVTHDLKQDLSPTFDDPDFDFEPAVEASSFEVHAPEAAYETNRGNEELEDFFADNFAEILDAETSVAETMEVADATPEIPQHDLEMDFEEAFAAEFESEVNVTTPSVGHVDPIAAIHGDNMQGGELEDEFAKAFEEEIEFGEMQPVHGSVYAEANQVVTDHSPEIAKYDEFRVDPRVEPRIVPAPHASQLSDNSLDDFSAEEYAAAPLAVQASSGKGFKLAIGALCMALVAGLGVVGWGAMSGSGGASAPVVIKADAEPSKVKPETPGGKEIANQENQVYDRVAGTPTSEVAQPELISTRQAVSEEAKTSNRLAPQEEPAKEQSTLGISPKKVRTFTVKPDGTIVAASNDVASTGVVAPAQQVVSLNEPVAKIAGAEAAATPEPVEAVKESIDGASSTGLIAVPEQSPLAAQEPAAEPVVVVEPVKAAPVQKAAAKPVATKPAAAKPAVAEKPKVEKAVDQNAPTQIANLEAGSNKTNTQPVVNSSDWKVQVSSQRSRDAAESSFNNISKRFSSVLSGRTANIEKADVDGKGTFYRVKILAQSKDEAASLCSRLKSAGGSCFVTR